MAESLNLLLAVVLICAAAGVTAAPPVWPSQWHAHIVVTGSLTPATAATGTGTGTSGGDPLISLLAASGSGDYYYDSVNGRTASVVTNTVTGQRIRTVSTASTGVVSEVIGSTGQCTSTVLNSNYSRWSVLPPDFVLSYGLVLTGNEYYLRDGTFHLTQHWAWNNSADGSNYVQFDYYHSVAADAPFRLMWTLASNAYEPVLMDVSTDMMAGLDDVASVVPYVFSVPANCPPPPPPTATARTTTLDTDADTDPTRTQATQPTVGTPWPFAFSAAVAFTGNDLGIPTPTLDQYVQQTLFGMYYYDWNNSRESSYWKDGGSGGSGARTKTTIVNGAFHAIDLQTGVCVIPPTAPVNGPLRPDWPTHLSYVDTQAIRIDLNPSSIGNSGIRTTTFAVADHFRWDAFGAGPDHSFNYWQRNGLPLQFNGPVLDFFPFYQSFMSYSEFTVGLDGVETANVFSVPSNCTVLPSDVDGILLKPRLWSKYDGASYEVNLRLWKAMIAGIAPLSRSQLLW